jgi:DNA-binding transcriptional LysR family regulator
VRTLDIELLRTFVAVVERESFAAAAQAVLRSQSAVTQQMQRLEALLEKPLFRRSGRTKVLTEDGAKVLHYARRLLALNDEAWSAIAGVAVRGEVRLGAPLDAADTILPGLLAHFSRHFPELRISIHIGRSPFLLQSMLRGELDMTVAALDAPGLRQVTLRTSPIVWMCAADFRYDPSQPLPLIVADEPSFFRRIAIEHLDRHGVPWRINYTSPTLVGVRAAVKAGLGVTARSVEMLGPDIRVLGEYAALPRLPDVNFNLYLTSHGASDPALALFGSLQNTRFSATD